MAENSIVERVALAIAQHFRDPKAVPLNAGAAAVLFGDVAQKAIAAMREPTNNMANAGTRCLALDWELTADGRVAPEVWTKMADAALEEK